MHARGRARGGAARGGPGVARLRTSGHKPACLSSLGPPLGSGAAHPHPAAPPTPLPGASGAPRGLKAVSSVKPAWVIPTLDSCRTSSWSPLGTSPCRAGSVSLLQPLSQCETAPAAKRVGGVKKEPTHAPGPGRPVLASNGNPAGGRATQWFANWERTTINVGKAMRPPTPYILSFGI